MAKTSSQKNIFISVKSEFSSKEGNDEYTCADFLQSFMGYKASPGYETGVYVCTRGSFVYVGV